MYISPYILRRLGIVVSNLNIPLIFTINESLVSASESGTEILMRQGHIPRTINSVTYLKVFEVHHLHEVRKRIVNVCGDQQHRLGTLGVPGLGNLIRWL